MSSNHTTDTLTHPSTPPDWDALRLDFPILDQTIDGQRLAYLDSAASSQIPMQTVEAITYHQTHNHSNVHRGVHTLSQRATSSVEQTRIEIAAFLHANSPKECIFVRGVTEGINLVAHILREQFQPGDNIVLTTMEHHSNIVPWYMIAKSLDLEIRVVDIQDDQKPVSPDDVAALVDERTRLFGCIHVSNTLGTVNDVKSLIAAARTKKHDVLTLVDGCQATLHLPIDVQDYDCDFYALSAHKMCGPTGSGILWGRQELLEALPPFMGGGDMILSVAWDEVRYNTIPHKFEAGTPAILPLVGFGATIPYISRLKPFIPSREEALGTYFIEQVSKLPGITILGSPTMDTRVSTFSLIFERVHPHDVGTILNGCGVAIRAGHHCTQPLMKRLGISATARASLAFYNNYDDIDQFVDAAKRVKEIFG